MNRFSSFLSLLNKLPVFILSGYCLIVISGCVNGDFKDMEKYIEDVNSRPKGDIEPLPEIKVVESFVFQPEGLRDPFQPIEMAEGLDEAGMDGLRPDPSRRKEELESYALETLQMVGTVLIGSQLWGLVRVADGSGTVHRVRVGNYMGKNDGKIVRISENRIDLIELIPDGSKSGTWVERQASLTLIQ